MEQYTVIYDSSSEWDETVYTEKIEFDSLEEALEWINEAKQDPYCWNFEVIHPVTI